MVNWDRVVRANHNRTHNGDGFELVTLPGATDVEVAAVEKLLGIQFPAEFRDLYSTLNGFGVKSVDAPDNIYWSVHPLENLPEFIENTRAWFRETHAELAERFIPLYDWSNGDGLGYMTDATGQYLPGLYCFEHELYRFTADQDAEEFFTHSPMSFEKFLTTV